MKLSIIIPVYNVEPYVGETLTSVYDTTASFGDFEVIVVNDGSEDGTMDVVRQFVDRPNITILVQENQGPSAARNYGLDYAKGEYVWFVDSDDWLIEDGVGKVLKLLDERQGVEVIMTPLLRRDLRYPDQDWLDYRIDHELICSGKDALQAQVLPCFWVQRFIFLRTFLISNYWLRFPMGLLHEDIYFGTAMMYSAQRVSILPDPIYVYRVIRPGSIMSSVTIERASDRLEVYRHLMVFKVKSVNPEDQGWFHAFCFKNLVFCYDKCLFDKKEFKSFVQSNGEYIYRQWREIHPNASTVTRIGRRLFYSKPQLYYKLKHINLHFV